MKRLMFGWPMDEAGEGGGGASQDPATADAPEVASVAAETPKPETAAAEKPKEDKTADAPVNLMADDEEEPKVEEEAAVGTKTPTDEERAAFVDAVKTIDIGEGVKWDDPALASIAPSLIELTGGDAKKAERLVRDYTAYRQSEIRAAQEANDRFLNGLVERCYERFGGKEGVKRTCALAKAGGLHVFGERLWSVMREERAFANNPDIIERLAAIGRTVTDDPGVVRKEAPSARAKRDWRENMYGGKR